MQQIILFSFFLIIPSLSYAQSCFFDHQVLTVPSNQYEALEESLSNPTLLDKIGATWQKDISNMKGFLIFPNKTYIEIWNESKFNKYGNQDVFRTTELAKMYDFSRNYGVNISQYGTIGKRGVVGNPDGGMFYIYNGEPSINTSKNGIKEVVKFTSLFNMKSLEWEYDLCQLNVDSTENSLIARGGNGVEIKVKQASSLSALGKVSAINFSTNSNENEFITVFHDDSVQISIELNNENGSLNFKY